MPFFPPDSIVKGPIFSHLDLVRLLSHKEIDSVLDQLRSRRNIVDVGEELGLFSPPEMVRHLRVHWFNETNRGWWKHAQPVEPIFRKGLITAVQMVRDHDVPLDSYWIRTDNRREPVRATVSLSEQQVTFLFHTPKPPASPPRRPPRLADDKDIWIVERRGRRMATVHPRTLPFKRYVSRKK